MGSPIRFCPAARPAQARRLVRTRPCHPVGRRRQRGPRKVNSDLRSISTAGQAVSDRHLAKRPVRKGDAAHCPRLHRHQQKRIDDTKLVGSKLRLRFVLPPNRSSLRVRSASRARFSAETNCCQETKTIRVMASSLVAMSAAQIFWESPKSDTTACTRITTSPRRLGHVNGCLRRPSDRPFVRATGADVRAGPFVFRSPSPRQPSPLPRLGPPGPTMIARSSHGRGQPRARSLSAPWAHRLSTQILQVQCIQ